MSDGSVERGTKRAEDSLATYQMTVQFKRYYIDVNENSRGRYIKIAEVNMTSRQNNFFIIFQLGANYKSRIILGIAAAKAIVGEIAKMQVIMGETPVGEHAVGN